MVENMARLRRGVAIPLTDELARLTPEGIGMNRMGTWENMARL